MMLLDLLLPIARDFGANATQVATFRCASSLQPWGRRFAGLRQLDCAFLTCKLLLLVRLNHRFHGHSVDCHAFKFGAYDLDAAKRTRVERAAVQLDGLRGLRLPSISDDEIRAALGAHERLDAGGSGRVTAPIGRFVAKSGELVLKRDHRAVLTAVRVGERGFVVKEVRKTGLRRRLADAVRGSPARRSFRAGHGLLLRDIGTAVPYAFLERRRFGLPVASWLILEDLRGLWPVAEPVVDAEPDLAREASRPPAPGVADAIARLLVGLHGADVSHGDLQAIHVLLRPATGVPDRVDALLIDCDAVRFDAGLGDAERIHDMAVLNASIPDRLLTAGARRRVFERVASSLPFDASPGEVLRAVARASAGRAQHWRGDGCDEATPCEARATPAQS